METNSDPNPSQPVPRNSKLGVSAFILSLVPILMFCIVFGLFQIYLSGFLSNLSYDAAFFISYLPLCPSILGIVSALAGMVLGVISLTRKEPRRAFAIAGIVLGILTGLAMCIVTFILLVMSRT